MGLEPYSPEFGRSWANDEKETSTVKIPATKFEVVTQVVMTEHYEQRDEPPGRSPIGKRLTVLAEKKDEVRGCDVAEVVRKVLA